MTYTSKTFYIGHNGLFTANLTVRVQTIRKRDRYLRRPDSKPLTSPRS